VLGLPLALIIAASRKWTCIGWTPICLPSPPIWNGVLLAYAFGHFADFSWGGARKV
ncbi:hypothetical protein C8R47DRAFT_941895, partial [Mycena vitilis]